MQFALPEDAATAVKAYDGKILLGRPVQVGNDSCMRPSIFATTFVSAV